jgi:hypothetical protein
MNYIANNAVSKNSACTIGCKKKTDLRSGNKRNRTEHNETDKLSKFKDMKIEVSWMWKFRNKLVTFIIEALGTVKLELDQNRQLLSAHRSASELQKVTLMRTAHSFR